MENHNVFAGAFVDRSGERRKDSDWLDEALLHEESRFVPVWGDHCLVSGNPLRTILLERHQIKGFVDEHNLIFLGLFRGQPAFALTISGDVDPPFGEHGEFHDLRYLGTVLPPDEANLAAHARALALWHTSQLFCGTCGSSSCPDAGGNSNIGLLIDLAAYSILEAFAGFDKASDGRIPAFGPAVLPTK